MRRARSVTGPLRRAHPASGATWNVQVVRGKMSSKCLWHACRALSAGLLLMLLGGAMAVIGYYADILSVDLEIRGNATISVKDEARGFHLNNLSYVGPIVMGFGGFIVVAACVMTFEARDSAAKVTPARPTALPRPLPRRGPPCAAPARLDQLGVYRLPHVLPLPHSLPLAPLHTHRHRPVQAPISRERVKGKARFGSAPDLRSGVGGRATLSITALRRLMRRYALSVDEPQSAVSASAAESDCGSQSSLALDLHASGACAGVTLRVRDNTRRRPLARQQRLRDDTVLATPIGSTCNIDNPDGSVRTPGEASNTTVDTTQLSVEGELRASSAPPLRTSHPPSPGLTVTTPPETCIIIEPKQQKEEMEKQTEALKPTDDEIKVVREVVLDMDNDTNMNDQDIEPDLERQIELQMFAMEDMDNDTNINAQDIVADLEREIELRMLAVMEAMANNTNMNDQDIVADLERRIQLQMLDGIPDMEPEETAGETEENQNQTRNDNEPRHLEFVSEDEAAQCLLESHPAYTIEYLEDTESEELAPALDLQRFDPELNSMPTVQEVDKTEEETEGEACESEENPESATNTQNPPPSI